MRLSSRLRAIQNMTTATASTIRYIHWSPLSGRPNGGSGLKMLMPCTPLREPLEVAVLQDLRHGHGKREGGERQVVALEAQRRQAEQVADDEAHDRRHRQRRPVGPVRLVDQDGRRVGADGEERAMAERDLAVEAGEQD